MSALARIQETLTMECQGMEVKNHMLVTRTGICSPASHCLQTGQAYIEMFEPNLDSSKHFKM